MDIATAADRTLHNPPSARHERRERADFERLITREIARLAEASRRSLRGTSNSARERITAATIAAAWCQRASYEPIICSFPVWFAGLAREARAAYLKGELRGIQTAPAEVVAPPRNDYERAVALRIRELREAFGHADTADVTPSHGDSDSARWTTQKIDSELSRLDYAPLSSTADCIVCHQCCYFEGLKPNKRVRTRLRVVEPEIAAAQAAIAARKVNISEGREP
jgi:hypothetical protein